MITAPSPVVPQTIWVPVPGCPGRSLKVTFLTEIESGPDYHEETTSAVEAGLVLDALSASRLRRVDFAFRRPHSD